MTFTLTPCEIPDVIVVERWAFRDNRGMFTEFHTRELDDALDVNFEQENFSISYEGVFRGMHYQLNPFAQAKLVTVAYGKILDIALDIRKGSPTYGKCVIVRLSHYSLQSLFIPAGFAHGFVALETSNVLYKTSTPYDFKSERGIIWNDPAINLEIAFTPFLSAKDAVWPTLEKAENNFTYEN